MKKVKPVIKILASILLLFLPITTSIYYEKNWQETGLVLIPSILIFVLFNISQFEILKFGKDGLEIRSRLEKADSYLDYIKLNTVSIVNTQISLAEQSFSSNAYREAWTGYNKLDRKNKVCKLK